MGGKLSFYTVCNLAFSYFAFVGVFRIAEAGNATDKISDAFVFGMFSLIIIFMVILGDIIEFIEIVSIIMFLAFLILFLYYTFCFSNETADVLLLAYRRLIL